MESLTSLRRTTRAALCAECGKCTAVCPLATRGGFAARSFVCQHLESEIRGLGVGLRRCLTCGTCELRCPQDVAFMDLVRSIRELTRDEDLQAECPHGGALLSLMRIMARGETPQDRLGWLMPELATEPERGEVFFWTGCAAYFDAFFSDMGESAAEATRAAVRLLNRLGIRPVVSPEERCCGHDLYWNGDREAFERLARHNVSLVARSGATTIVASCAECARTWKVDYERFFKGRPPRVLHLSELIADRLSELRFKTDGRLRVTFQDPCRLGRHLGIYEPPRKVLAAVPGLEVIEMQRSGRTGLCCAGGTWSHCDRFAKQIQEDRLREARSTGAEVLVTACPKCRIHFRCAMRDPRPGDEIRIAMRDVAEILADALA